MKPAGNKLKLTRTQQKLALADKISFGMLFMLGILSFLIVGQDVFANTRPDWAKEFYGQLTFRLMDDPVYSDKYVILDGLLAELNATTKLASDKQKTLETKNAEKQTKTDQLGTTQESLRNKNLKLQQNQQTIQTRQAEVSSANNGIAASEAIIRVKENELTTLNNTATPLRTEHTTAVTSRNQRQTAYDNAFEACTTAATSPDCTADEAVILAKFHLDRAVERVQYLAEQIANFDKLIGDANKIITDNRAALATQKNNRDKANADITKLTAENTKLATEIPALIDSIGKLSTAIDKLNGETSTLSHDLLQLRGIITGQEISYANERNHFDKLEEQLIEDILSANRMAYQKSRDDGAREGIEIARTVGDTAGEQAGRREGAGKGEADGRARDFARGAIEGEEKGKIDGEKMGREQAQTEGVIEGHRLAGANEGQASGLRKAEASDASTIGAREGRQSGLQQAQVDGQNEGQKQGEAQAIQEEETKSLTPNTVRGPYAATFNSARALPQFPGIRGLYRSDESGHSRRIIRLAYIAGYATGYDGAVIQTYDANVGSIYDEAHARFYSLAYEGAVNKVYEDSFRQGRDSQYATARDRERQKAFTALFPQIRDQALANPNRSSSTFINAFKTSETQAYSSRYEQIRQGSRTTSHRDVYAQNIAAETDKARQKRKSEVSSLYSRFPVLKLVSSSILDNGVKGVAKLDGIYQPGEEVAFSAVVINYGGTEATGAKLTTADGQTFNLPAIPARSTVTLSGIGKTQISESTREGTQVRLTATVKHSLTSGEKHIQGRHFANRSNNTLASISHQAKAEFPLVVNSLSLTNPLLLGTQSGLVTKIQSKGNRAYQGPIEVELTTSRGQSIVKKSYANLATLGQSATLSDAIVEISDSNEVYNQVSFSVAVRKNGVLLGFLSNGATDYVKAPYVARANAPVLVLKSERAGSREVAKDVASYFGGNERISILDLSAGAVHQRILDKELAGKTILVTQDSNDGTVAALDEVLKTKNVFVAFLSDRRGAGALNAARRSLPSLRNSTDFVVEYNRKKFSVVSTANTLNSDLKYKTSMVEVELADLENVLPTAELLKLTTEDLLAKSVRDLSVDKMTRPDTATINLVKTLSLRNIEESMVIDTAYRNSKGARRFLFFKLRDKAYLKRIEDDKFLVVNQLISAIKSGDTEVSVNSSLVAPALYEATLTVLKGDAGEEDAMGKVRRKYKSVMKDATGDAKKVLKKKVNKKIFGQLEDSAKTFAPYPQF